MKKPIRIIKPGARYTLYLYPLDEQGFLSVVPQSFDFYFHKSAWQAARNLPDYAIWALWDRKLLLFVGKDIEGNMICDRMQTAWVS